MLTENKRLNDKKKRLLISIGIVMLALALVGGTFAYILVTLNVVNGNYAARTDCFDIIYDNTNEDGTMDITGTLNASNNYRGGLSGNMAIGNSCNIGAKGSLILHINEESSILTKQVEPHCENSKTLETLVNYTTESSCTSQSNAVWVTEGSALKYVVYEEGVGEAVSVGYIDSVNEDIKMYENFPISNKIDEETGDIDLTDFTIYIWLDGNISDGSYSFVNLSGYMYADATSVDGSVPNAPVLDEGMIPVTIDNSGNVTTVSERDPSWYDYLNQKWANVVLVTDESRSVYQTTGVEVLEDDILAYYVWIPRYKYKIWKTAFDGIGEPQKIDLLFELENAPFTVGSSIGSYMTHPAFWWDDDNDGVIDSDEMLSGIWVGKFETTGSASKPTVLPNENSLKSQRVNKQFKTSLLFSGGEIDVSTGVVSFDGNDIYGLTLNTNSHMAKNNEWGAVAYLSHSKYGMGVAKVESNTYCILDSSKRITNTGCGYYLEENLGAENTDEDCNSSSCINRYGEATSYPQSTTGNISGIFDMSGGSYERVMGNYNNQDHYSYRASGEHFPEKKYYDLYTFDSISGCTLEFCGGHALYETAGWHNDSFDEVFVTDTYYKHWFSRGGAFSTRNANIFYIGVGTGDTGVRTSFRSVLIIP